MRLPSLRDIERTRDNQIEFRGYNHNITIDETEFYDMSNESTDNYPILSRRPLRGSVNNFFTEHNNGMFTKNGNLAWVDGTDFKYNGVTVGTVSDTPKQFVGIGAYIVIFPDKKMFNTAESPYHLENLEASWSRTVPPAESEEEFTHITIKICNFEGEEYDNYLVSQTAPVDPADGELWMDISVSPPSLKQFSEYSGMWVAVNTGYVKLESAGIGAQFANYDGITIEGTSYEETIISSGEAKTYQYSIDGKMVIYQSADDYIVTTGFIAQTHDYRGTTITLKREVPDMDFLTESENRVWGCNSERHEIYACKLGDPKNWNVFMGIASDSYAVTVGTDGNFTGAITHLGYVLFFKEDCIHKLYGTKPANYQLISSHVRGVERGSEKSLVIINETLYYKSRNGVVAYDGSLPMPVSEALGKDKYINAVAGGQADKYYLTMYNQSEEQYDNFVYDTVKRMWAKEENLNITGYCRREGDLYYTVFNSNTLYTVDGANTFYETVAENMSVERGASWFVETGDILATTPDLKYVSKIQVRFEAAAGSGFAIYFNKDSSSVWDTIYDTGVLDIGRPKYIYTVPIVLGRIDHFRLKFEAKGKGDVKVYAVSKVVEQGSEIKWQN